MSAGQYANKAVVVTGASSGLGREIASELARRGASVVIVARRMELLTQLAEEIECNLGTAVPIFCDVTDGASVKELAAQVKERFSKVHLLVNNAGKELMKPFQVTKADAIRDLMELNIVAVAEVTRSFIGLLSKGGSVVNMASAVGLTGTAGLSVYAASKAAVIALTRSLAKELAGREIRVNAVAPGMVQTEMADRMLSKLTPEQKAQLEAAHPLGFGAPRHVAAGVAFLGSEEAAWITGHTLVVDGGLTA